MHNDHDFFAPNKSERKHSMTSTDPMSKYLIVMNKMGEQ